MRKLNLIMKSLLGGAAALSLVACEEVDPPKPAVKPVVTHVAPVEKIDTTPAPVVTQPPKVEVKAETPKKVADEDGLKPRKILDDAREALDAGELDRSMKLAKMAVQKMPNRSAAWNTLGRAQLKSGFRSDAIESFQKAIELNPSSSYAENNLGLAFIYEGKFEDAIDALEEAVELEPVEGYMWNNLGMAYEHVDRLDEARDAYRKAADAKAPNATKNLARLEGVKTIRTAKADTVKSDVTVGGEKVVSPVDLPHIEVDGGGE